MIELRAFHSDPAIKVKYLTRVDDHIKADRLVRGLGWDNFRGCAIGCTLEAYDHSRYPIELGIPEWLARVEDNIFEGMSLERSATWPRDFLAAITPGDNLERVKGPFLITVLESTLANFDHTTSPDVKAAIDESIALWRRTDIGSPDWDSAENAAWSAASAAESAAASAAASAAWSAANAAWSAASAAWSAESAAESAAASAACYTAWSAVRAAAYDRFGDQLLILLASPQRQIEEPQNGDTDTPPSAPSA